MCYKRERFTLQFCADAVAVTSEAWDNLTTDLPAVQLRLHLALCRSL